MRQAKELKNINPYLMYSLQASFSRKKSVPLHPIFKNRRLKPANSSHKV